MIECYDAGSITLAYMIQFLSYYFRLSLDTLSIFSIGLSFRLRIARLHLILRGVPFGFVRHLQMLDQSQLNQSQ